MTLTPDQQDALHSIDRQLNFMSGMILAWDTDRIEIDDIAKDGFWYMLECIRKDLKTVYPA